MNRPVGFCKRNEKVRVWESQSTWPADPRGGGGGGVDSTILLFGSAKCILLKSVPSWMWHKIWQWSWRHMVWMGRWLVRLTGTQTPTTAISSSSGTSSTPLTQMTQRTLTQIACPISLKFLLVSGHFSWGCYVCVVLLLWCLLFSFRRHGNLQLVVKDQICWQYIHAEFFSGGVLVGWVGGCCILC